jgi:hypothetical protein
MPGVWPLALVARPLIRCAPMRRSRDVTVTSRPPGQATLASAADSGSRTSEGTGSRIGSGPSNDHDLVRIVAGEGEEP